MTISTCILKLSVVMSLPRTDSVRVWRFLTGDPISVAPDACIWGRITVVHGRLLFSGDGWIGRRAAGEILPFGEYWSTVRIDMVARKISLVILWAPEGDACGTQAAGEKRVTAGDD